MNARELFALTLSVAIVAGTVGLFLHAADHAVQSATHNEMVIDGRPVVNLAPVVVTPTPAEIRAAFAGGHRVASRGGDAIATPALVATLRSDRRVSGNVLAMPYYSFAAPLGTIGKD